jgi:hypothetical protein
VKPSPRALRLVCSVSGARPPVPPFGLASFVNDADADVAVMLDVDPEANERAQLDAAAAQIPAAAELPAGRIVVLLPQRAQAGGFFSRLLASGRARVSPAVRATALLARGYTNLGADDELVWGVTRPS